MDKRITNILKYSGLMFMGISTVLFYNHLFTAAGNPGFFVTIYFDFFGEGLIELCLFIIFIPFIFFTFTSYVVEIFEHMWLR